MVKTFALFFTIEDFNDLRCFNVFFNLFFELFMIFDQIHYVSTVPYELAKKSYIIDLKLTISVFNYFTMQIISKEIISLLPTPCHFSAI